MGGCGMGACGAGGCGMVGGGMPAFCDFSGKGASNVPRPTPMTSPGPGQTGLMLSMLATLDAASDVVTPLVRHTLFSGHGHAS
eukprot:981126-Pyramimonas_sp.AAC.1